MALPLWCQHSPRSVGARWQTYGTQTGGLSGLSSSVLSRCVMISKADAIAWEWVARDCAPSAGGLSSCFPPHSVPQSSYAWVSQHRLEDTAVLGWEESGAGEEKGEKEGKINIEKEMLWAMYIQVLVLFLDIKELIRKTLAVSYHHVYYFNRNYSCLKVSVSRMFACVRRLGLQPCATTPDF